MFDLITNRLILYFIRRQSIRMTSIYVNQIYMRFVCLLSRTKRNGKCFINEERRKNRLYFTIYSIK